tara:strand:- start:4808 stop:5398 length:591 start_codon:yes stop_codon:yes gene_type:complete
MQKIKKILIGTNNKGKFKEISDLLPKDVEKVSPEIFNLDIPIENGKTFLENSEIKADFFCKKTNLVTLSDDSGLEIESLNGAPGIFSARWAKEFGSFDNAMNEIIKKVNKANKGTYARFICSLTMQWPDGKKISELGIIKGKISQKKGKNGFGYDPIFIPAGYSKTFGEMNYKEKILIDHRYIAYKKLEKKVKIYF